jgi:hypothetical protein
VCACHEDTVVIFGELSEEGFEGVRVTFGQEPHGVAFHRSGRAAQELSAQEFGEEDDVRVVVVAHIHISFYLIRKGVEILHGAQTVLYATHPDRA